MKRAIINLGLVIFTLLAAYAPNRAEEEWQRYEYKDRNISIEFPYKPESDTLVAKGIVMYTSYVENIEDTTNKRYTLLFSRHGLPPIWLKDNDSLRACLKFLAKDFTKGFHGKKLIGEEISSLQGYPGIEVTSSTPVTNSIVKMRLYIVGENLVCASVLTDIRDDNNLEMRKFFNSISLPQKGYLDSLEASSMIWKKVASSDSSFSAEIPSNIADQWFNPNFKTIPYEKYSFLSPSFDKTDSNSFYTLLFIKHPSFEEEYEKGIFWERFAEAFENAFKMSALNTNDVVSRKTFIKGREVKEIDFIVPSQEKEIPSIFLKIRAYNLENGVLVAIVGSVYHFANNYKMRHFFESINFSEKKGYANNRIKDFSLWLDFTPPDSAYTIKLPQLPVKKSFFNVPGLDKMQGFDYYYCPTNDTSENIESYSILTIRNQFDLEAPKLLKRSFAIIDEVADSIGNNLHSYRSIPTEIVHNKIIGVEYTYDEDY